MTTTGGGATISRTQVNGPVTINGVVHRNVQELELRDGVVYLDGKAQEETDAATGAKILYKSVEITVTGDVNGAIRTTSGKVSVGGNCVAVSTTSGSVAVAGNVFDSVSTTSGSIYVTGSVRNDLHTITGRVETGPRVPATLTTHGHASPAFVAGDLTYSDSRAPKRARPATVEPDTPATKRMKTAGRQVVKKE